mgnify:CR=1 FL=1
MIVQTKFSLRSILYKELYSLRGASRKVYIYDRLLPWCTSLRRYLGSGLYISGRRLFIIPTPCMLSRVRAISSGAFTLIISFESLWRLGSRCCDGDSSAEKDLGDENFPPSVTLLQSTPPPLLYPQRSGLKRITRDITLSAPHPATFVRCIFSRR